jgi:hypothetical protein
MFRILLLQVVRQFISRVIRVMGFAVIMFAISIFAVFRGLWTQSDFVANAWRIQLAFGSWDGHGYGPMYWTIRIIALLLMLVCLIVMAQGLAWLVEQVFRL